MIAATVDRYGPPEVLTLSEVPRPVPGEGEVLIRNHASLATPPDCAFRSARPFIVRAFAGLLKPRQAVLGEAIAGIVEAVGQGVTRFAVGDRVYGVSTLASGAYAEYIATPADGAIVPTPEGVSFAEAVAASDGYLTALPFLRDHAHLKAGQQILINGASGSVGGAAVQLARQIGAHVTAVCSGRNADLVRSLGADAVIDYTKDDFTARAGAFDVIFDAIGKSSFPRCRRALTEHGVYMTTVPSFGILRDMILTGRSNGRRALLATTGLRPVAAKVADLVQLNGLLTAGTYHPTIDRTFPLAAIADAHRYVETERKTGSVVISIP